MQPDLLGLEFSKGELRRLIGVDPDNVFRASIFQNSKKRLKFLSNEILIWFTISTIVIGLIYTFIVLFNIGSPNKSAIALLILAPSVVAVGRWLWRKKTCPKRLKNLLDDVDKYQAVSETIDSKDSLNAEIAELKLNNRSSLIEAVQLTREDLVKALKAERSLRSNNSSIAPELFNNNLQALTAIQASNQASEYGQILNEVLQINISIQQEMRKLQGKRSNKK